MLMQLLARQLLQRHPALPYCLQPVSRRLLRRCRPRLLPRPFLLLLLLLWILLYVGPCLQQRLGINGGGSRPLQHTR